MWFSAQVREEGVKIYPNHQAMLISFLRQQRNFSFFSLYIKQRTESLHFFSSLNWEMERNEANCTTSYNTGSMESVKKST